MGKIGLTEIILILLVVVLLFGGRKIPELMKGIGQGMKEFKKANKTVSDMDIYFSKLIEKKKKIPANDLITHIIRAKVDGHSTLALMI